MHYTKGNRIVGVDAHIDPPFYKPKIPPTVGANTVRPQRARCEPYSPIQRREMISLTAAAAACSPLRGIHVFWYAIISPLRKFHRTGEGVSLPFEKGDSVGVDAHIDPLFYKPKIPPTVGANIVRPKVPLEKGDVTIGDRGIPLIP